MNAEERRQRIFDLLTREGHESIEALAEVVKVSAMTIRRDLTTLENQGLIRRTHGGAVVLSNHFGEISLDYQIRQRQNAPIKRIIGQYAAQQVQSGDAIFLDAGSSVLAMAPFLLKLPLLTVVTHSLPIAEKLSGHDSITVYLLGGQVRRDLMSVLGHQTEEFLATFRLSKAFIGTGGVDLERGLTHDDSAEIAIKRLASRISDGTYVLADRSKIGKTGLMYYMPMSEVDMLITNNDEGVEIIKGHGALREARTC